MASSQLVPSLPVLVPLTEKAARSVYFRAVTQTGSSHATYHGAVSHPVARGLGRRASWEAAGPTHRRPLWAYR